MKVILGVSGGVDSSVAALLLQQAGHEVEGMFMQNWEEDDRSGPCTTDDDRKDAVAVCGRLGIPFHARNFAGEYWDGVFAYFLAEYAAGRTPNPDVLCNREIKFKTFLEHAQALGAEKIATGHYARVDFLDERYRLLRAVDAAKDQSYFLHALGQKQLAATLFPVGEIEKPLVRELAREARLPTHAKKDSTGICFIGERDFRAFLAQYLPAKPGPMVDPDGRVIGEHQGVMYYTLGQRNGLGIGGRADAPNEPWYVVGKEVATNTLIVAQGGENRWLQSSRLTATDVTWVAGEAPATCVEPSGTGFRCTAKTRYRQADQACTVELRDGTLHVSFDEPQRAVTPGQSVVLYDGEVCLGGAVIDATDAPYGGLVT
ncbi:tRNA (5-methylaminomethyl-2-thiouridylate)-methyltransferase [Luteibacter sp. OK325]|uniref:tRNA 2-thiouridine(34) synthase MnmA n=1 Tax=Luteibacter sp. OK325 TaxID=2135670 RepID=UPI000D3D243A|nr:tRNA 2-thiouridine(34) synthase MnmA [Luteibacter sp. OK325]PTR33048.1 tRNA (5-methylaminomethyl-2-thiouridylate)-methyltransferase [Luteibacter sp. OK325]